MEESNRLVCTGGWEVKVYDIETLIELKSIDDYTGIISSICKIDQNHFATTSSVESKMNLYNINTF
jgi:hypothetical protein